MSSDAKQPSSKKKEGFLRKQAKSKTDFVTEEELLKKETVTPDDVLRLPKCTESEFFFPFYPMHLFLTQRTLTLPMVGFAQSHSGSRFKLLKFTKLVIIRKEKLEKLFYACSSAEGILSATLHTQSVQFVNKKFNKHVCQIQGETENLRTEQ